MNQRKRWATKQEAMNYVAKCQREGHYGLRFCAACDFLGLDAAQVRKEKKTK